MNVSKKNISLFYIEKNKGIFLQTGVKPLIFSFPEAVVNNLEIKDKSKFEQLIAHAIMQYEIKPTNILVVLSKEVLFEKELKDVPLSLQSSETEKFLDMVPLHHILTKTYNFS